MIALCRESTQDVANGVGHTDADREAMRRDDDHGCRNLVVREMFQDLHPVHVGQFEVLKQYVGRVVGDWSSASPSVSRDGL